MLKLERYELREVLGQGGMGVVYRAVDTRTGGLVAIKTLRDVSDTRMVQMFRKEWQTLTNLSHPNIVDIRDAHEFVENGVSKPYFVMPLLSGVTLAQLISESSARITVSRLVAIFTQACHGLEAAHRANLIHRDLKPSNIFVMEDDTAKLIDFGLVHAVDVHSVTSFKGTWQYMAPEQTEGKNCNVQSDIFSLGVTAYEAFTGRKPFARKTMEATVEAVRKHIPPPISEINPKVTPLLSKVIHKAMAKSPMHRYASAKEFADLLQKAYHNEAIERFDTAKIHPRVERARQAFRRDDATFASEMLSELEAEGNVDPEISLLRAQIEEAVKHKRVTQLYEAAQTRLEQDEVDLALDKLAELLSIDPENQEGLALRNSIIEQRKDRQVSEWIRLARQHLERHDFAEARQALKEVRAVRYEDPEALQLIAEIDVREKNAAQARTEKEQLYGSALRAYQGGEITSALSKLERILDVSRQTPDATVPELEAKYKTFYNRVRSEHDAIGKALEDGRRFLKAKNFARALEVCNETLTSYPHNREFQGLKLQIEQAERQELSAYIASVGKAADEEPDLDRRVSILQEACRRYPNEAQFQQSLRLLREHRDLVQSILQKARQYEEAGQFADAIAQWNILRNIHGQYPGIEFEIAQLEKRRQEQAADEKKTRFVEQIDRAMESGSYALAASTVAVALEEFPQDSELLVLERMAKQGLDRVREAERLGEEAKAARAERNFDSASDLLKRALALDERNAGVKSALVSLYLERAEALVKPEPSEAEKLIEAAGQLDQHHPSLKRLRRSAEEEQKKAAVSQLLAEAREKQLSGNLQDALEQVGQGLTQFPGEPRLQQFSESLQNTLSQAREEGKRNDIRPVVTVPKHADATALFDSKSGQAAQDGLTDLYARTDLGAKSTVVSPPTPPPPPRPAVQPSLVRVRAKTQASALLASFDAQAKKAAAASVNMLAKLQAAAAGAIGERKVSKPVLVAGFALAVALVVAAVLVLGHRKGPTPTDANVPSPPNVVAVPLIISPDGARLAIDGQEKSERPLKLDSGKTYDVVASRLGYKPTRRTLRPESGGWTFTLQPEPVRLQVRTSERNGKLTLDNKEIWDLQAGDLINFEVPADGKSHTLAGHNATGDLFSFSFRAPVAALPEVEPLTTRYVVAGTTLGDDGAIVSGTNPSFVSLPGQSNLEILRTGSSFSLRGTEPEALLEISDGRRRQSFTLPHGNAPVLAVAMLGNSNLGSLTMNVPVPGAKVLLDGRERKPGAQGTWRILGLTPGEHKVEISAEGYIDEAFTISLEKGEDARRDVQMKPAAASLVLTGGTPGAEVFVDGVAAGVLDGSGNLKAPVSPGTHKIELRKEDFESSVLTKNCVAGRPTEIDRKELTLRQFGTLVFDVTPSGATVEYSPAGRNEWHAAMASESVKVKAGRYDVRAGADHFDSASKTEVIEQGQTTRIRLSLAARDKVVETTRSTSDFFLSPPDIHKATGGWYTGEPDRFHSLKPRESFVFTFLKPERMPGKHKNKKVEWRVFIAPDVEVRYELDDNSISRNLKVSGKSNRTSRKVDIWSGDIAVFKLTLENRHMTVTSRGVTVDDFSDPQHNWLQGSVSVRGDQYFLVNDR